MNATQPPHDDLEEIKATIEAWTCSWISGELDQWQEFWTEDGVLYPPSHDKVSGRKDLVSFASKNLGQASSFSFSDWAIEGSGDLAIVTNTIRISPEGNAPNQPASVDHQMIQLLKDEPRGWRVHKVIYNAAAKR